MDIQKRLFELQDKDYALFQSRLVPDIDSELIIGVRVPTLRKFAKELKKNQGCEDFLKELPHKYYDENMLHGILISEMKDYIGCIERLNQFLPYIDNWAVCDILSPKIFKKNKDTLLEAIYTWSKSKETYTCRFGIGMLMSHFLDEDFDKEYLKLPAGIKSEEYYVNMMLAWFFATALAKQWESTLTLFEEEKLDVWVHNKSIQKAGESYRIDKKRKDYLLSLKRK